MMSTSCIRLQDFGKEIQQEQQEDIHKVILRPSYSPMDKKNMKNLFAYVIFERHQISTILIR